MKAEEMLCWDNFSGEQALWVGDQKYTSTLLGC